MSLDDERRTSGEEPRPPASSPPGGGQSFGGWLIALFVVFLGFLVAWKAPGFRILVFAAVGVLVLAYAVLTPSKRIRYDGQLVDDPNSLSNTVIGGIIRWIGSLFLGGGDSK
jgi:hypothetical protein